MFFRAFILLLIASFFKPSQGIASGVQKTEDCFHFRPGTLRGLPSCIKKSEISAVLSRTRKFADSTPVAKNIPSSCSELVKFRNFWGIDISGGKDSEIDFVRSAQDCFALKFLVDLEPSSVNEWKTGLLPLLDLKKIDGDLLPKTKIDKCRTPLKVSPVNESIYEAKIQEPDSDGMYVILTLISHGRDSTGSYFVVAAESGSKTGTFSACSVYLLYLDSNTKQLMVIEKRNLGRCS